MTTTVLPPISRIAIIGAGAGGLVTLRALLAERRFSTIDCFEQRSVPAGVWNYTPELSINPIPSTNPNVEETPILGQDGPIFPTAMYDQLG